MPRKSSPRWTARKLRTLPSPGISDIETRASRAAGRARLASRGVGATAIVFWFAGRAERRLVMARLARVCAVGTLLMVHCTGTYTILPVPATISGRVQAQGHAAQVVRASVGALALRGGGSGADEVRELAEAMGATVLGGTQTGAGAAVLPAAGPPPRPGEIRRCAHCNSTEFAATLAFCRVTELHFCMQKQCRKDHWSANKEWWREQIVAKKPSTTPVSGMPLPVDATYTALGNKMNDVDRYPHDDDRPPSPPERKYAQPPDELDPKVHTWSGEFQGINQVLWEAAGDNDVPLVKQALADGAIINAGNPNDLYCWTALHKGAYRGAVAAVKLLLEAGADVEARDTWNKTGGTHASASICLLEAAAAPLLSCAAAAATDLPHAFNSALILAAEMGGFKMTELLLAHGADVTARNKNNQTGGSTSSWLRERIVACLGGLAHQICSYLRVRMPN